VHNNQANMAILPKDLTSGPAVKAAGPFFMPRYSVAENQQGGGNGGAAILPIVRRTTALHHVSNKTAVNQRLP